MKITFTIILVSILFTCNAQYHIIVECYGEPIAGDQYYHIKYTNNNWITLNEIKNSDEVTNYATSDIDDYREFKDVDYTPLLSLDKRDLIRLAKKLKTIKIANRFNDSVLERYERLHRYWMNVKPKFKPMYHPPVKKCCKVIQVY